MRSADTLGRLLELIPAASGERWLDAACGPGLVARGLAARVGEVRRRRHDPGDGRARAPGSGARGRRKRGLLARRRDRPAVRARQLRRRRHPLQPAPHPGPRPRRHRAGAESCGRAEPSSWPTTSPRRTPMSPPGTRRSSACAIPRTGRASRPHACVRSGNGPGSCSSASRSCRLRSTSRSGSPAAAAGEPSRALIAGAVAERVPAPDVFRVVEADGGRRLELVYWLSLWRRPSPSSAGGV